MKDRLTIEEPHSFRARKPPAGVIKSSTKTFQAERKAEFSRWAEYRRHQNVIQEELARRLLGSEAPGAPLKKSLAALRASLPSRLALRDPPRGRISAPPFNPPPFQARPGLNILGPPYDFGSKVYAGSNAAAVMFHLNSGQFAVTATASDGDDTYGAASVFLIIHPSATHRTLSIRPYFEWKYLIDCESHGPPTAHSVGDIVVEVTGHRGTSRKVYPPKKLRVWSASSDAWDDSSGAESGLFGTPDAEVVVSGHYHYVVRFGCSAGGDSGETLWWWSAAYMQLHCRVPFLVVEEY